MSEELIFASENEALQHLTDLTGKSIKIAAVDSNDLDQVVKAAAHGMKSDELKSIILEMVKKDDQKALSLANLILSIFDYGHIGQEEFSKGDMSTLLTEIKEHKLDYTKDHSKDHSLHEKIAKGFQGRLEDYELEGKAAQQFEDQAYGPPNYASEKEALQHLADLTGKKIRIANISEDVWSDIAEDFEVHEKGVYGVQQGRWDDPAPGIGRGTIPSYNYLTLSELDSDYEPASLNITLPDGFKMNDSFQIISPDGDSSNKTELLKRISDIFTIDDLFEGDDNGEIDRRDMKMYLTTAPLKIENGFYQVELEVKPN